MTVCAQSSQRATWPPSAAVRQRSMAAITFNWSRLTCPALARRHAAPWSRKISATSNAGRDTAPALRRQRVFLALLGLLARLRQQVERALDAGDHAGGDTRVARRRLQLVVTQQRLDNSNIGAALEQVGREAVAQRVQRHGLLYRPRRPPGETGGSTGGWSSACRACCRETASVPPRVLRHRN